MISLELAKQLKNAGLTWEPQTHDFFAVPDTSLADQRFALSDMTVSMEVLHGHQAITFNGAVEWALDYVFKMEAVWIPTENQLRTHLLSRLQPPSDFQLSLKPGGFLCQIVHEGERRLFEAESVDAAYAHALLFLLAA
ncbi:MAG: pilus assembly protein CpaE [Chloroflexota bacterium]